MNDLWRFMPALGPAAAQPEGQWGWIRVPGTWERDGWPQTNFEGLQARGTGGSWEGLQVDERKTGVPTMLLKKVDRSWYEREVAIPQEWAGREIVLDVQRVSTDARVFIDGKEAGTVGWPGGELVITPHVKAGAKVSLRMLVVATQSAKEAVMYMDANRADKKEARLNHRGIMGDVVLMSRPRGPRLDGVFIKPSLRKQELAVDVEFADLATSGDVKFTATLADWKTGKVEKTFTASATVAPGKKASLAWKWTDPRLWEFQQPNLYTLRLTAEGAGLKDGLTERFGFREFRIDGKRFLLNEKIFNMRLHGLSTGLTMPEVSRQALASYAATNLNTLEIWPNSDLERGVDDQRAAWAAACDEAGMLLMCGVSPPDDFDVLDKSPSAEQLAQWQRMMLRSWKLIRNNPSVGVILFAGNRFAHEDDLNPRRIGNRKNLSLSSAYDERVAPGRRLLDLIRQHETTRPVTSHHNGNVGDIHTANTYLDLIPLQEREQWLSAWAKEGDMPYSAIEFGAPFGADASRGRVNHTSEKLTEPWLTEHLAVYQGAEAYRKEDPEYRKMIQQSFKGAQAYEHASPRKSKEWEPFVAHWISTTLRAWRTWGISGGMWHWDDAYGWRSSPRAQDLVEMPTFTAGSRGPYARRVQKNLLSPFEGEANIRTAAGSAFIAGHNPILAWLAGPSEGFTQKDHHFTVGEKIRKQSVILNDTRADLPYSFRWRAEVGGREIAKGEGSGTATVGAPKFDPIEFAAPEVGAKSDGVIVLETIAGNFKHEDRFSFRIYPAPKATARGPVMIWDPRGDTAKTLSSFGIPAQPWSGAGSGVLVIGRNAFEAGVKSPGSIETFLDKGGRVILMGQNPEFFRTVSPYRVSRWLTRRAWPVTTQATHPLLVGLDGEDFRDWRGSGTLISPERDTDLRIPKASLPQHGWHWGNQGSVSSSALEKPHFSTWRPILEGDFDLAFSPLMELPWGNGLLIYCGLDLESRTSPEPVARMIGERLVQYAAQAPARPRVQTHYIGDEAGEKLLRTMQVRFEKAAALPSAAELVIVGPGAAVTDADLQSYLSRGGRAVILPRADGALPLGFTGAKKKYVQAGGLPAWEELRGISLSDLRLRTEVETQLIDKGPGEIAAGGALGKITVGNGRALFFQLSSEAFNADEKTYLRFSRWRVQHALSQVLANLGAEFAFDRQFFRFAPAPFAPLPIASGWKAEIEAQANQGLENGWAKAEFQDSTWTSVELPQPLNGLGSRFAAKGTVWLRRAVDVPADYGQRHLMLNLGLLDDAHEVWWNGVKISGTEKDRTPPGSERRYRIRAGTAKPGKNLIAVRITSQNPSGGFILRDPASMRIELTKPVQRDTPYYPDYRSDFALGDDHTRYFRW
ncbi:MAG TPA: hypothetical protein VF614_05160 [Chthoniobacteraceae bacterium]